MKEENKKLKQMIKKQEKVIESLYERLEDFEEIRPEFVEEMKRIEKEKHIPFKDIKDLRKQLENKK